MFVIDLILDLILLCRSRFVSHRNHWGNIPYLHFLAVIYKFPVFLFSMWTRALWKSTSNEFLNQWPSAMNWKPFSLGLVSHLLRILRLMSSGQMASVVLWTGALLVQQARATLNMERSIEHVREKLASHEEKHRILLKQRYPVRSRIPAWMNERFQEFKVGSISRSTKHGTFLIFNFLSSGGFYPSKPMVCSWRCNWAVQKTGPVTDWVLPPQRPHLHAWCQLHIITINNHTAFSSTHCSCL